VTAREAMLSRVRQALATPSDAKVRRGPAPSGPVRTDAAPSAEAWLPIVPPDFDGRVALFAELSEKLKTDFRRVADLAAAIDAVRGIAADEGWDRVATHDAPPASDVAAVLGLPVTTTDAGYDKHDLAACPASVTACDALVAQTASVLVSTRSAGGRALSVLPEHHVVVATADQLIADLPSAMRLVRDRYGDDLPSYACLITGPSRTGDIERILVLGAHGPKRLTVLLVG